MNVWIILDRENSVRTMHIIYTIRYIYIKSHTNAHTEIFGFVITKIVRWYFEKEKQINNVDTMRYTIPLSCLMAMLCVAVRLLLLPRCGFCVWLWVCGGVIMIGHKTIANHLISSFLFHPFKLGQTWRYALHYID